MLISLTSLVGRDVVDLPTNLSRAEAAEVVNDKVALVRRALDAQVRAALVSALSTGQKRRVVVEVVP